VHQSVNNTKCKRYCFVMSRTESLQSEDIMLIVPGQKAIVLWLYSCSTS